MRVIFGFLCITLFLISCSSDSDSAVLEESNQSESFTKSEFNSGLAYQALSSSSDMWADYFEYSNIEKREIWLFKFNRFKNENDLTSDQISVVDALISDVNAEPTEEFRPVFTASRKQQVYDNFHGITASHLIYVIPNPEDDYSTDGDKWRVISAGDCTAETNTDGEATGDFFRVAEVEEIGGNRSGQALIPCSMGDWERDGNKFGPHPF